MLTNPKETKNEKKGWEKLIEKNLGGGEPKPKSFDPDKFVEGVLNYKRPTPEGKEADDTGLDNFKEGLEQGSKSLWSGFGYAVGEGLDRIGADKTGQRVKKGATIKGQDIPAADDSWGQFLGSIVPSTIPTAVAIASAPFTGGSSIPAMASIAGLSVSSAGNGMMEYEAYKKEKGQEVDETAKLAVGIAYGVAEGAFERLQLGKLMPDAGKMLLKGNVKAAEKVGKDVLETFRKQNPSKYRGLMNKVKDGLTTEGLEEVGTEIAQAGTQLIYQEDEDRRKTIEELPKTMAMAMLGGSIMGAGLGPLSYGSQQLTNRKRRKANGGVTLIQSKEDGQAYELLGMNPGGKDQPPTYTALDKNGEPVVLAEEEVGEVAQLSVEQFDKLLQDKLDTQEVNLFNMQPKQMATYGEDQVIIKGPAESEDKVYVEFADGSQRSVPESELEDIEVITPEEQYIAEGNEIADQPAGPVESIRDKQEMIETPEGDLLYPDDPGYEEALEAQNQQEAQADQKRANTRTIDVGTGKNAKRLALVPDDDGGYNVGALVELVDEEPVQRDISELTETEVQELTETLNKTLSGKGLEAVAEPTDANDPLSPSQIRVYEQNSEAIQQKRLDEYSIKADGAKVKVVNSKTGKAVGPGSKFYLPKIKQYFSENAPGYSQMERVGDDDKVTEQNYLSEVASRSENPVEIAEAYGIAVEQAESRDEGSTKEMAIARALSNNPNLSRKQLKGRGLDEIYKGIAYANYAADPKAPSNETMGLDELSELLSEQTGQPVTEDDIMDFIRDNPGGPSPVLNQKDSAVKKLEDAFREVTGAEISPALAQSITESNLENQTQRDTQPEEDSVLESEFDNVADEDLPNTGAQNFTAEIAETEQQLRDEGVTDESESANNENKDSSSETSANTIPSENKSDSIDSFSIRDNNDGDRNNTTVEVTNESETETTPVEEQAEEVPGESEATEGSVENDVVAAEEGEVTGEQTSIDSSPDSDTNLGESPTSQATEQESPPSPDPDAGSDLDAREQQVRDELSDLFDEFDDLAGGQLNMGIDPKMITISGKIIAKGAELGYVKLQQFADWVINNKGADFWRRIFPNFKAAYSANLSMEGNPNNEDLNAIAKSTAEDYIQNESALPEALVENEGKWLVYNTPDGELRTGYVDLDKYRSQPSMVESFNEAVDIQFFDTRGEMIEEGNVRRNNIIDETESTASDAQSTESTTETTEDSVSDEREYSSTQVNIEGETAQQVIEFAESIPKNELYTDGSGKFGAETEPHVTALFGLTADNADQVRQLLQGFGPVELTLGETSLFENENYDVLKVDIDSPDLVRLNQLLRDNVEFENDFPDYQPHMTIAYLKPGEGAKYAGDTRFEGQTVTLDELLFSGKDRTKTPISLISEELTESGQETSGQNMSNQGDTGQPTLFDNQPDNRVRRTELPEPKDGWREGLLKARKYAIELGIKPTKEDGSSKSLNELVNEVDAYLSEETTEPSTPKARAEISHGLKQDGQTAFEQLSTFIDLKNLPDGYHQKYGEKGDAIMPLTIEKQPMFVRTKDTLVDPDAYYLIVEQWGIQNGDIMSDPRVDFLVYPNLGLAFPYSFTNSYAGVYQEFVKNGFLSHEMAGTVDFLEDSWVPHITGSGLLDRPSGQQETETETNELTGDEQLFVSAIGKELEAGNQLNKRQLEDLAQRMGVVEGDKRIKELAEYAIILRARELAGIDSTESAYQAMVELYENQPNLTARTSESIKKQQYSTPAPIAYLMGVYTNLHNGVAGFEPSAGNGLLTIAAGKNPSNVRVNEIDGDRLEMLRLQSFYDITEQDGTEVFPFDKSQQAIVTNPPFGATDARYQAEVMGRDIELSKLEHVMAARALDTMRDGGKAAILIGGNDSFNDSGNRTGQDRSFFHFLHHYYNVDQVLNFGGNVFNKQGANFPTRVILINGRKDTPEGHAPMNTEGVNIITDLTTLYQEVAPYLTEANNEPILQSELDAGRSPSESVSDTGSEASGDNESGAIATVPGGRPNQNDQSGGEPTGTDSGDTGTIADSGGRDGSATTDVDTDGQRRDGDEDAGTQSDGQAQSAESEGNNEGRTPRDLPREKSKLDHRLSADDIINNEGGNVVYSPLSDSESITTEMPASMAFSMVKSLNALADEVGNVDAYVMEKVGFESVDQLYDALAGEQVDAVALAIYQAERGKSVVVGDQTGIGKGRVAATMIRYAKQRGIIPVFWTEKPKLFSDIHRDLKDIGVDYRPFIVNARDKGFIVDESGKVVHRAGKRSAQNRVFKNPELVSEFDYVALTYSQIQSTSATTKRDFIRSIASNALIIMDESHNASGESNTGEYLMEVLNESQGAVYLSATFAKRPDNMPVYAIKTDISDVAMNQDEMVEAIERGGVALQEIISSDLVKSGQMVRRQRSFKGVKRSFEVMGVDDKGKPDALGQQQRKLYDDVSEVMRNIIDFQTTHVTPVLNDMADDLNDYGITEGTDKAGVDNQPFVSRIHHIVDMLLFSVKADAVADRAIEVAQSGRKPIIAIKSTMESVLDDVIATGETVDDLHFGLVLTRALDSVMKYRVTDGISGDKDYNKLSVADLTPMGQKAYERITQKALDITAELKGSPIDYIVNKIEEAGFSIGEVTGRSRKVVYDENGRAKAVNRKKEETDKNILFNGFNSGELDMLLINSSGATGASAHSSENFKDQRQRVMIIHQPELNINTEVQKWGRIFRTGQVNLPEYQYITSAIPAELRLMMVLKKKIKSLDANTTSSQKTSSDFMDTSDFINKYGDEIVTGWFRENQDMQQKLQHPIKKDDWSKVKDGSLTRVENLAMKVTGRMAFMPSDVQESFYEEISQSYDNYIDALNEMGENELVMDNIDLQAETLDKKVIVKGKKPGTPFGGHTYLEKVKAKTLRKPLKADEIEAQVKSELDGQEPQQYRDDLFAKAKRFYERREADQIKAVRESDRDADEKKERIAEIEQQAADEIKRLDKKSLFFIPGQVYVVPADAKGESGVTTNGVFLGYGINGSAANPYSASAIKIRFAVNSSQRTMTVPTSFNGFINAIKADTQHLSTYAKNAILKDWDSNLDTSGFETRHIITGNVLQGLSKSGNKGQLIQYTTNDGSVKNGVLLSANIKQEELDNMDSVRIEAKEVEPLVFNLGNGEKLDMSANTGIRRTWGGEYQLFVPSSKVRGSRYYLDDTLLDMVVDNNFVKKGNEMRATVPIQNMGRVLEYLSNEHSIYADVSRNDLERVTEGDGPMFKRGDQGTPISDNTEKIATHLENLVSDWKSKDRITVARTFEELPYMVQRYIENEGGGISGTYLDGKVYINAYEHSDIESAERTLLHETVGHLGFRGLLENMSANRDQYNRLYTDLTLSIYDAFKGDAEFQRIANKYEFDFRYNRDKSEAAEEFLAHMAERGDQAKSYIDKFVQLIKDALAAMGFRTKLTRADIIDLITDMRRLVNADFSVYNDGHIMRAAFKRDFSKPFFSELQQTLQSKLSGKGTAKSYREQIEGFERKGDFRKAEIEWVGLHEWLDEQSGKLTREEVVGFVRDNNVQMEEVMKVKEYEAFTTERVNRAEEGLQDLGYSLEQEMDGSFYVQTFDEDQNIVEYEDLPDEAKPYIDELVGFLESDGIPEGNETRYGEYTLPGGMDYKEMLITLPAKQKVSTVEVVDTGNEFRVEEYNPDGEFVGYASPNKYTNRTEAENFKRAYERNVLDINGKIERYRNSHWNESNVLAHVRFNTREGNMLFLEEIQSDWHQQGRKSGYKTDPDYQPHVYKADEIKLTETENQWVTTDIHGTERTVGKGVATTRDSAKEYFARYLTNLDKEIARHDETMNRDKVPDAPFKTTWHELAIKRMIRYAAENGFQKVGWAPGEVHNERYKLSKQVDRIEVEPEGSSNKGITIVPSSDSINDYIAISVDEAGKVIRSSSNDLIKNGTDLSDVVGKEMADRIMAIETVNSVTLEGEGLEIGGEGMKGFYDKILPRYLNKYLKKWDSKLGVEKLTTIDESNEFITDTKKVAVSYDSDGNILDSHEFANNERVGIGYAMESISDSSKESDLRGISEGGLLETDSNGSTEIFIEYNGERFSDPKKFREYAEANAGRTTETQDIWSFPITPDMMRSVMSEGQPMFKRPDPLNETKHQYQKKIDGLLRNYQNKFIDGKRIQEGVVDDGGILSDKSNFTQDEENHYGRIENLRTEVKNNFTDPLMKEMRQLYRDKGVKYNDLRDYLYANHAPERNEYLYEQNPEKGEAQSGMSDQEAAETMRKLEQRGIKEDLENVAQHVYDLNKHTVRMQYIGGLISKERFGQLLKMFDNYVPLRGFDELMEIDPTMFSGDRTMQGRQSKAGDILAYVQAMSDTAIIQGEKNRVKQSFLQFVIDNYERSDLFKVRNVYWKKTGDIDPDTGKEKWLATFTKPSPQELLDGTVKRRLDPDNEQQLWEEATNIFEESTIKVMKDGRPVVIEVTKPHIARAFAQMDVEQIPRFVAKSAAMMNWLRNVITQYSPEFGLRNIIRDSWTGLINVSIDHNIAEASKIVNPVAYAGAMKALRNYYRNGKFDDSEWGKAMKAFMKHGAVTGYWQLNVVKDHTKNLKDAIERGSFIENPGANLKEGIKHVGHFLDDYNRVLENVARVSAFKHLTQDNVINPETGKPYTNKQAANYARNLTVNFNRKGNSTGVMGSLYLFFNATVQGIARQVQPFFSEHTRIRNRAMAAPVVMGATAFAFAELLRMGLGKDDDEEWRYDKINDFTRTHNIILPNWFSDDEEDYLRIPLPYGYNVYWAAGDAFNRLVNGSTNLADAAIEMAGTTIDAYNPIGTVDGEGVLSSGYKSIVPTVLKPGMELITNTDFKGDRIKPEPFPFAVQPPESQQHYKYVATWAKETAQWFNRATGGDEFTSGSIDVSPEYLEYLANFVGGGPARFIDGLAQTGETVRDAVTGLEEPELYDIYNVPFARSFYGKVSRSATREKYIENQREVEQAVSVLESYYETGQPEKARQFEQENANKLALYNEMRAIEKQARLLRQMNNMYYEQQSRGEDNAKLRDEIQKIVESQHELYLEFNRMVNEVEGRAGRKTPTQKVLEALK